MNEAETRAELIDPALREAGGGVVEGSRVRRELITPGRLEGAGRRGRQGVGELDDGKLPHLLELKYHAVADAVAELGDVATIREVFIGFQEHLYAPRRAA